jgi:hypothetical protein
MRIQLERLRRALLYYFRLGYSWRVAKAKAGYYDGRLEGPHSDEHRHVEHCGSFGVRRGDLHCELSELERFSPSEARRAKTVFTTDTH